VHFALHDLRDAPPAGPFDLIVFSELGYYFPLDELASIAGALASRLEAGGELVAVHWLGSEDHVLHGDEVHTILSDAVPMKRTRSARHSGFRLDAWVRP
jgi:chemotaxis methyl-accepting protein methylase